MSEFATGPTSEQSDGLPDHALTIRIVLAELALVLLIFVGVAAVVRGASAADPNDSAVATKPATIALTAMPEVTADIYRYAAAHVEHFVQIPCFCGCQKALDHRNLEDCFVNEAGWDPHASGCGVCTAEAVVAREQLDAGVTIADVRQSIIVGFGPLPEA